MRSVSRFIIGLIAAMTTFATLSLFAKPFYAYNKTSHYCWGANKDTTEQKDKTDY